MSDSRLSLFCENFTKLRKKHGYTKKKMSEICGISVATINKMEKGIFPIRLKVDIFEPLYYHFGIRSDYMFVPWDEDK